MKAYKQSKRWLASTVFKEMHGETQPTRHLPPPTKTKINVVGTYFKIQEKGHTIAHI